MANIKVHSKWGINELFRWAWLEKWSHRVRGRIGAQGITHGETTPEGCRKDSEARPLLGTHITLHRNAAERTARPLLGTNITYDVATSQFPHCLLARAGFTLAQQFRDEQLGCAEDA